MTRKLEPPPDDFDENPELTEEHFAPARPFREGFPEQYKARTNRGRRPHVEQPKVHVGFRLASDVVKRVRESGPGYNARVEKVLREALEQGRFLRRRNSRA
jgi:uncharacterized protein (DUF4415 family)